MNKIYLDNNATTKCDEEVLNEMLPYLKDKFGNPSSIYSFGNDIKNQIIKVQEKIGNLLNAKKEEIIFTSGATESNVTAIMSTIKNNPDKNHIITTKVEHSSVIETMKYLEKNGYIITYLSVDEFGKINLDELKRSITAKTCLVSIMFANNEIGNIYPIKEIGKIVKKSNILFHVDATQAIGKVKVDVKDMNIDMLSFSGHKIYAPKGIGVLYVSDNINFTPLIFGHQQSEKRGGTENVPFIIGLGKAIDLLTEPNNIKQLRDYMESQIQKEIEDVKIYGDLNNRLVNTSSIAFKGVNANELMLLLESFGVYVSTGSACNSYESVPSYVLLAMQVDLDNYMPIRISLGKDNIKDDIDELVRILKITVNELRKK